MFYSHLGAHGRLNKPSDFRRLWSKVKDEIYFRYAHTEIRIWVVVICGPMHYQLDLGGAVLSFNKTDKSSFQLIHNLID